ncbi:MAG TPA: PrsW family glutamic-type intramembrane protease [Polyangiaceae bacterium]|nr:PrsW family glutamic-type intramembrane protease [Polyangiaceae bacterium]
MISNGALALIVVAALVPLGIFGLTWRLVRERTLLTRWLTWTLLALGVVAGYLAVWVEGAIGRVSGLDLMSTTGAGVAPLLATLVFAAPLEDAFKLLILWILNQRVRIRQALDGLFAALAVAAGFAVSKVVAQLLHPSFDLPLARVLLGSFGQLFFTCVWGTVLGSRTRVHLLGLTWFASVVMHAVFEHIVFGRGRGALGVLVPLLLAMFGVAVLAISDLRKPDSTAPALVPRIKAPSLRDLSRAILRRERPLSFGWIIAGAFVTTGMVLALLVLAIVVGNRLGIDFAAANEDDVRANGPLMFLALAILSGFPFAGYLIARASSTASVLESAVGALLAIIAVVTLLSLTAPVAVVFALAVAPVALGLACIGAWFGLRPS